MAPVIDIEKAAGRRNLNISTFAFLCVNRQAVSKLIERRSEYPAEVSNL